MQLFLCDLSCRRAILSQKALHTKAQILSPGFKEGSPKKSYDFCASQWLAVTTTAAVVGRRAFRAAIGKGARQRGRLERGEESHRHVAAVGRSTNTHALLSGPAPGFICSPSTSQLADTEEGEKGRGGTDVMTKKKAVAQKEAKAVFPFGAGKASPHSNTHARQQFGENVREWNRRWHHLHIEIERENTRGGLLVSCIPRFLHIR